MKASLNLFFAEKENTSTLYEATSSYQAPQLLNFYPLLGIPIMALQNK